MSHVDLNNSLMIWWNVTILPIYWYTTLLVHALSPQNLETSIQLKAALDECCEEANYAVSHISQRVYPIKLTVAGPVDNRPPIRFILIRNLNVHPDYSDKIGIKWLTVATIIHTVDTSEHKVWHRHHVHVLGRKPYMITSDLWKWLRIMSYEIMLRAHSRRRR